MTPNQRAITWDGGMLLVPDPLIHPGPCRIILYGTVSTLKFRHETTASAFRLIITFSIKAWSYIVASMNRQYILGSVWPTYTASFMVVKCN